jgi:carboxypeptidase D
VSYLLNYTDPNDPDYCYGLCDTYDAADQYCMDNNQRQADGGICGSSQNINVNCSTSSSYDNYIAYQAYLNTPAAQAAIHAPAIDYEACNGGLQFQLLGPIEAPAFNILPKLLSRGIKTHIWAGDLDWGFNPLGHELAIQNMTWNGKQGLQRKPDNVFWDTAGARAGTWGKGRGLSYHRFERAGHMTPADDPSGAYAFVRDFVL